MASSFYLSRYVEARKGHTCENCYALILQHQVYLRFVTGERTSQAICLECSVKKTSGGKFSWDCTAVRDRVKELGEGSGHQPQPGLPL